MLQAAPDVTPFARPEKAAEIAALNARALKSIGREIEELLRISREAGEAAYRLIVLLDLGEPDPDLEPSLGWYHPSSATGDDRERDDADDEFSLGWTHAVKQDGRKWQGLPPMTGAFAWGAVADGEAEHDGREPDADLEPDADDEDGHDEEGPMRVAPLKARRDAGKEVRP